MTKLDVLLRGVIDEGGSDLHVATGEPPRIRVDGELLPIEMPAPDAAAVARLLQPICPEWRWQRFLETGDVDFAHHVAGRGRFRANYLRTSDGLAAVFRLIPETVRCSAELQLPDVLRRLCNRRRGLVLVTGPTGSGKSTTLAAMIDDINRNQARRIVTVEDPLEFIHRPSRSTIIHREVGEHCPSFAEALHSAVRSDPDVLLVGEMRDAATIRQALSCAAMGALVFATLHTNSAAKTVDRVIGAFAADEQPQVRAMLAETLAAVVAQQLCRRRSGGGRVAAFEVLLRTPALPHTIREGLTGSIRTIIEGGGNLGMVSMDAALKRLLADGAIAPSEAYAKAVDKDLFLPEVLADNAQVTAQARDPGMAELDYRRYTTALSPEGPAPTPDDAAAHTPDDDAAHTPDDDAAHTPDNDAPALDDAAAPSPDDDAPAPVDDAPSPDDDAPTPDDDAPALDDAAASAPDDDASTPDDAPTPDDAASAETAQPGAGEARL
jgi:twitching motility protein PilT